MNLYVLHLPLFSLLSRLLTLFSNTINHLDCSFFVVGLYFSWYFRHGTCKIQNILCNGTLAAVGAGWLKHGRAGDTADAVFIRCDIPTNLQAAVANHYTLFT